MKKLFALLIMLPAYIQASEASTSATTGAISESVYDAKIELPEMLLRRSFYIAPDLVGEQRTSPRSLGERSFVVKGNCHFMQPDQCMLAIVDERLPDFESKLAASLAKAHRLVHADEFATIFKERTMHSVEASLLIANHDRIFIGVHGAQSRIVVLAHNDISTEYSNITTSIKTPVARAILLLRGVTLSKEVIAGAAQEQMQQGNATKEIIKSISTLDPAHTVAIGMLNLDSWTIKKSPTVELLSLAVEQLAPSQPSAAKAVKTGCCFVI
jgi:hypothetical protein